MRILKKTKQVLLIIMLISGFSVQAQFNANAGNDTSFCVGDSATLGGNPIATGGLQPYNYTWTPNYKIDDPTLANPTVWPDSSITYVLTVGDANGRSAKDSVRITIGTQPPVYVDSIPDMCMNDDPLQLSQGNPSGGYYLGPGIRDSATYEPMQSGVGQHTIWYYYTDVICKYLDSASGTISTFKSPRVTLDPKYDTICSGETIELNANGASTYQWNANFSYNFKSGDSIITASPTMDANVTLIGTLEPGGCQDSTSMFIVVEECVGIQDFKSEEVILYPNPFKDQVRINWQGQSANFRILNQKGQLVQSGHLNTGMNALDLSDLENGAYIFDLTETGRSTLLIKQN